MSVLGWQKDETAKNTERLLSEAAAHRARCRMSALALRKTASLPCVRKDEVLAVREQLAEGTYDLDRRLDAVLDSLLSDLTAQGSIAVR